LKFKAHFHSKLRDCRGEVGVDPSTNPQQFPHCLWTRTIRGSNTCGCRHFEDPLTTASYRPVRQQVKQATTHRRPVWPVGEWHQMSLH